MPFDMSGVFGLEGRGACTVGGRIEAALPVQRQEPRTVFTAEMLRKHSKKQQQTKEKTLKFISSPFRQLVSSYTELLGLQYESPVDPFYAGLGTGAVAANPRIWDVCR